MSEEIQKWICLGCGREMDAKDMEWVNENGCCPYCKCSDFNVKIYEVR